MVMIYCTCGHEVNSTDNTVNLALADFDGEGNRAVSYVCYCKPCADNAIEEGYRLRNQEEMDAWLNPKRSKCRYSTNWMGVANLNWYIERGLTKKTTITFTEDSLTVKHGNNKPGDTIEVDEPIVYYSCGRIDVRGGDTDVYYGDEIGVPPMRAEDWGTFGEWLRTIETDSMWTLKEIVEEYEKTNPKIRWADGT
jgi:hypothetical protein